jgi:hypothetical protein
LSATLPDIACVAHALTPVPLPPPDEAALESCLEPLRMSAWPDIAWQFSRLTRDGFPLEFAFCGHEAALRLTLEPAGPEVSETSKLDCALRLLENIGHPLPEFALTAEWRDMQGQAPLRWGTWLGLRQTVEGLRTKLYLEVPRGARHPQATGAPLGGRLRMLGYEPRTRRSEFYYSLSDIDVHQLAHVLTQHGIEKPHAAMHALAGLTGLPVATALQWLGTGLSIATVDDRRLPGVALFFRAAAAHRGQGRIRDALLQQQTAHGIRSSSYRSLFAGTEAHALPDHGVVTLALRSADDPELRAGISGRALLERSIAHRDPAKAA